MVYFRVQRDAEALLHPVGDTLFEGEDVLRRGLAGGVDEHERLALPDGSAGSFFKNPVVSRADFGRISPDGTAPHFDLPDGSVKVPAAWMIDQCGFKGASEGGAAVYDRQPLVIVNQSGEATPQEVLALEQRIINGVQERFGVTLHPEVEHI